MVAFIVLLLFTFNNLRLLEGKILFRVYFQGYGWVNYYYYFFFFYLGLNFFIVGVGKLLGVVSGGIIFEYFGPKSMYRVGGIILLISIAIYLATIFFTQNNNNNKSEMI